MREYCEGREPEATSVRPRADTRHTLREVEGGELLAEHEREVPNADQSVREVDGRK